jgi:CYTH domain-containing protein
MNDLPKYSRIGIERRWLVDLSAIDDLESWPCREIDDLYIADTRLRLRKVSGPNAEITFKLGKKYGRRSPVSEPITTLYLTEAEHRQLSALPGARTRKLRYSLDVGAVDVYLEPKRGLGVFEIWFTDEPSARAYRSPSFVTREVTPESVFSRIILNSADTRSYQVASG